MNYQRFIEQLPSFYDNWGKDSVRPKSNRFERVIKQVKGMTSANLMQLLNFAVDCMEQNEIYCEVGCFQGASLIGALLEHPEQMAYAVDNFSEFDAFGDSFDKLLANLSTFNLEEQVVFCNQEVEKLFFEFRASQIEEKIDLYFCDGARDYRSCLMGLLLVKPFLAEQSLIVLINCNWEAAYQASLDFIASHPQSQLLLDFSQSRDRAATVWNGLQVISWDARVNNQPDWSSFHKARKTNLIDSIYQLHANDQKKVLEDWHNEAKELYLSGEYEKAEKKYEKAEKKYKQILNCDVNHAETWFNLGLLYYKTERYQDALNSLFSALDLDSSNAIWHYSLGLVLEELGTIPQAIRAYQEAIAIDPQWISAYNRLGTIWFEAGDLDHAESMYRQVLSACPEHCAGYINLGNVLMVRNQVDEAIEVYEKALSLKPRDPDILNNLGVAFEAKNDKTQASSYYGYSFYRQGKYQEAIGCYQQFLEQQTGDVDFYLALTDCYESLNQYEEAFKVYREGIRLYPKAELLYLNLAIALRDYGSTGEALACKLPVVTCPGEFMRGRHSYGILKMLGVTETIAKTEAEYIDIAVRLGLDPAWRESIVQRMVERHSYLYEDKTCVTALEAFYRQVVGNGNAEMERV